MNCQRSFKSEPFRSGDFRLLEKRKWHDWAIERKHRNTWGFMKYIESRSESKRYCYFYIFLEPNKANAALCFLLFTRTLEAHQKVVILPISVDTPISNQYCSKKRFFWRNDYPRSLEKRLGP